MLWRLQILKEKMFKFKLSSWAKKKLNRPGNVLKGFKVVLFEIRKFQNILIMQIVTLTELFF